MIAVVDGAIEKSLRVTSLNCRGGRSLRETVAALKEINPEYVIPMHCTGEMFIPGGTLHYVRPRRWPSGVKRRSVQFKPLRAYKAFAVRGPARVLVMDFLRISGRIRSARERSSSRA